MERDTDARRSESEESVKGDILLKFVTHLVINQHPAKSPLNMSTSMTSDEQEIENDIKKDPSMAEIVPRRYGDRIKKVKEFIALIRKYPHIKLTLKSY